MTETLRLAIEVDAAKGTAVVKEFTGVIDHAKGEWGKAPAAAQGPLAQFNAQMKQLQANWSGIVVGAGIVAGGVYVAARAIGAFADAASEAEQIESRMAFQINQVGYNFSQIKPLVDDFADSILRTTRFSDEMARQGLGQMMQYTSDVNQGMQGVRLAMDMTTQTGQDLQSTTRLVGMAMNGNAEILGRWIPELRDLDAKLGANATSADKAAYAIDVLNKKFGGAALADLETYAGKVQYLKNQWDEIKETVGKEIVVPGLKNWLDWINLAIEGGRGLKDIYDQIRAAEQALMTGESASNILIRERGEELKRLAKIEQEVAERGAQLQRAKKETEELEKIKALRAEQQRIDLEYQSKYFALIGDRISAIERERDQALQVAWQKGLRLVEIERYYNGLILDEKKRQAEESRGIMSSLGVKTEAGAQAEIVAATAQYEKLLKSGLFTPEQIEAARLKIVEKLREIQAAYSNFFGEVSDELRDEEGDLKVRWTQMIPKDDITRNVGSMVDTVIKDMDRMTKEMGQPRRIQIDDSAVSNATASLGNLEDRLNEIVSRAWKVNLYIVGYGSSELPITEKIKEVADKFEWLGQKGKNLRLQVSIPTNIFNVKDMMAEVSSAFQQMGPVVGNTIMGLNQKDIANAIASYQADIVKAYSPHNYSYTVKAYREGMDQSIISNAKEQIEKLQGFQSMLSQAGAYAAAQAAPAAAASESGGGYGGGIEININTINVLGGSDLEIAQKIDEAIAELIFKGRSKIKAALA